MYSWNMRLSGPCFVAALLPVLVLLSAGCRMGGLSEEVDKSAIRITLDKYVASIESASSEAARQVWAQSDDVSFIHPLGHERGFEEIRANFYEKLMSGMFSRRKLSIKNVEIHALGNSALVSFYWDFHTTWRKDGSALTSQVRETDLFVKDAGGVWKLLHVHYSGMPTTNLNRGF